MSENKPTIDEIELTPEQHETLANIRANYQREECAAMAYHNQRLLEIHEDWAKSEQRLADKALKRYIREAMDAAKRGDV